jgi:hypothetical protein
MRTCGPVRTLHSAQYIKTLKAGLLFRNSAACLPTVNAYQLAYNLRLFFCFLLRIIFCYQFSNTNFTRPIVIQSFRSHDTSCAARNNIAANASARSIRTQSQHEGLSQLPRKWHDQVRRLQRQRLSKLQAIRHQEMRCLRGPRRNSYRSLDHTVRLAP